MSLAAGSRLAHYEIAAPLGAGGMGAVYRARDTRLGREVAIKMVLPAFAADGDRIARLEREARALAALNHPHIATLYGLEQAPAADTLLVTRFVIALDDDETFTQLTRPSLAVSPDGSKIAYVASAQLFVRYLSQLDATPLRATLATESITSNPTFSPDGSKIAYFQAGQIKIIDLASGTPVTVCAEPENVGGLTWSGD